MKRAPPTTAVPPAAWVFNRLTSLAVCRCQVETPKQDSSLYKRRDATTDVFGFSAPEDGRYEFCVTNQGESDCPPPAGPLALTHKCV